MGTEVAALLIHLNLFEWSFKMSQVTMHGKPLQTNGELPQVGQDAPDFQLTGPDMSQVKLSDSSGKIRILSIVPSVDTGVCSLQTARFDQELQKMAGDVVGYSISVDTPFALKRWIGAEDAEKIVALSDFKDHQCLRDYGVYIEDAGMAARSVVIVDGAGKVAYTQLVPEISDEPNYDEVLNKVNQLV